MKIRKLLVIFFMCLFLSALVNPAIPVYCQEEEDEEIMPKPRPDEKIKKGTSAVRTPKASKGAAVRSNKAGNAKMSPGTKINQSGNAAAGKAKLNAGDHSIGSVNTEGVHAPVK